MSSTTDFLLKTDLAADRVSVISPILVSWSVYDPEIHTHITSNAILTSHGWWLVDPSPIQEQALKGFLRNKPLLGILITNENHERAAYELAAQMHLSIHAHEAARGQMRKSPKCLFRDGDELKGGLKVLHLPGASEGESSFHDPGNRVLLMGDALINLKETGFAFLPDKYCKDPLLAKRSLRRLLDLEFDTMTFAHGEPLDSNPRQQLQELLNTA